LIGESPERLSLAEQESYRGWWMALEIYTPQTLPLRLIEALETTSAECIATLRRRGMDPAKFEFVRLI